jgi:hypothetical protein
MELKLHNAAIVYLSFSLLILFIGIKRIPKTEVIIEILLILFITFILNILCINRLNKVAWYFVIFFILIPIFLALMSILPMVMAMLSKKSS